MLLPLLVQPHLRSFQQALLTILRFLWLTLLQHTTPTRPKMRVRRASPLLLLLAPSLVYSNITPDEHRLSPANIRKREPAPELIEVPRKEKVLGPAPPTTTATTARATTSTRPYRGTEDAPVDGFDGKPHLGPFVDTTPEEKAKAQGKPGNAGPATTTTKARPTSLDKFKAGSEEWRLEDIPERNDGVMNDENRIAPKKGTTGTEGGISEKEKERRLKGFPAENKPQEPKEAPPLPHSEEEWMRELDEAYSDRKNEMKDSEKGKTSSSGSDSGQRRKYGGEYGAGGYGIDLPEGLPDKPHKIPHPEPKAAIAPSVGKKEDGPPVSGGGGGEHTGWLADTMPYTEGQTQQKRKKPATTAPDGTPIPSAAGEGDDESSWHEWFHSYILSLTMILFSEIGDKTFLVAALMAMRHSQIMVFSAALSALVVMTVLSAVLGHAFPALLPKRFTTFAAACLFLVFGAKMLREGLQMPRDMGVGEEMKEVEAELEEKEIDLNRRRSDPYALEAGRGRQTTKLPSANPGVLSPPSSRSPSNSPSSSHRRTPPKKFLGGFINLCSLMLSPAWVQTFTMTFLGEWGDRSQIATIAMAAGQDYWWVTLGAVTGHACCTGLAVVGGRALAGRVSLRVGEYNETYFYQPDGSWRSADFSLCHSHHRRRARVLGLWGHLSLRVCYGCVSRVPYCYQILGACRGRGVLVQHF